MQMLLALLGALTIDAPSDSTSETVSTRLGLLPEWMPMLRAAGYTTLDAVRGDVRVAQASSADLVARLRAARATDAVRQMAARAQAVGEWMAPANQARFRALDTAWEAAMEAGDDAQAEALEAERAVLFHRMETAWTEMEEGGDDAENPPDAEGQYLVVWLGGIECAERGVPDAAWGGWNNQSYPLARTHFDSRAEWLDALRSLAHRWFSEPGASTVPTLRQEPTDADLIALGHDLWDRRLALWRRRADVRRREAGAGGGRAEDPEGDVERVRFAQHAALLRLAKLPTPVLQAAGWTGSETPAERRRTLATAPPGLLSLPFRVARMSMHEAEDAFFAELERAAGPGQTFYARPFIVIGDRKGGVLGNLELHLNASWGAQGVSRARGVHLAFVGVSPEARGQGRGRRLVQIVIEAANAVGLPVDLEVDPQRMRGDTRPPMNKAALRAFYRSLGFAPVRAREPDYLVHPAPT